MILQNLQNDKKDIVWIFIGMAVWTCLVFAWAWNHHRLDFAIGFLLGSVCSILYVIILFRQIMARGDFTPQESIDRLKAGLLLRLSFALSLFISCQFWPQISFPATILGYLSFQTVLLIYGAGMYMYRIIAVNHTR